MRKNKVFFRNDDVRETLDKSLVKLTDIFINKSIPITHAVEPANITKEVIGWLIQMKRENPSLIEIIQHGYNHSINYTIKKKTKTKKGEFGGNRTYEQEYEALQKGKKLMDDYFGNMWTPVITFPFGSYNANTIKAVNDLNYIGISSGVAFSTKSILKDTIGQIFNKDILFNKKISYHNKLRHKTGVYELDTSLNFIKKYINENEAIHFSLKEIINHLNNIAKKTDVVGVLFHHRYHDNILREIEAFLTYLKNKDYTFSTLERIIYENR